MLTDPMFSGEVRAQMSSHRVHPLEVERVLQLLESPETLGDAFVPILRGESLVARLADDLDEPHFKTTDISNPACLETERLISSGIGAGSGRSQFVRLFIGGTSVDAPLGADVVHLNVMPEDMKFAALGPRVLTNGRTVPVSDGVFDLAEGYHVPYDHALTPHLLSEVFRTVRIGGLLLYAPSTDVALVADLLRRAGFVRVAIRGLARRTVYRGRTTFPTQTLEAYRA